MEQSWWFHRNEHWYTIQRALNHRCIYLQAHVLAFGIFMITGLASTAQHHHECATIHFYNWSSAARSVLIPIYHANFSLLYLPKKNITLKESFPYQVLRFKESCNLDDSISIIWGMRPCHEVCWWLWQWIIWGHSWLAIFRQVRFGPGLERRWLSRLLFTQLHTGGILWPIVAFNLNTVIIIITFLWPWKIILWVTGRRAGESRDAERCGAHVMMMLLLPLTNSFYVRPPPWLTFSFVCAFVKEWGKTHGVRASKQHNSIYFPRLRGAALLLGMVMKTFLVFLV